MEELLEEITFITEYPVAVSFSFPVEELLQTAAVPGTEEPVVTETEPESEEDTAAPTKEDPREETTEWKEENSPEKRAGEATEPTEPHDNHFGIWTAVLLCLVAAAVVTGILFYRRRTK